MKKENRGGPRKGSGPKTKYNEATTTVAFRVPVSKSDEVKAHVLKLLSTFVR
jgi:hypothetical protein